MYSIESNTPFEDAVRAAFPGYNGDARLTFEGVIVLRDGQRVEIIDCSDPKVRTTIFFFHHTSDTYEKVNSDPNLTRLVDHFMLSFGNGCLTVDRRQTGQPPKVKYRRMSGRRQPVSAISNLAVSH